MVDLVKATRFVKRTPRRANLTALSLTRHTTPHYAATQHNPAQQLGPPAECWRGYARLLQAAELTQAMSAAEAAKAQL
eukprot:8422942-Pyramimonas_sp.AAC.1